MSKYLKNYQKVEFKKIGTELNSIMIKGALYRKLNCIKKLNICYFSCEFKRKKNNLCDASVRVNLNDLNQTQGEADIICEHSLS